MLLVPWFEPDIASKNIRDRLLEIGHWTEDGDGILRNGNLLMKGYPGEHLYTEGIGLDESLSGKGIEGVVVLSRHRAESGTPALTVHATGNFAKAEYGGRDGELSVSFPRMSGGIFRALRRNAAGLDCAVSLEVTHHGPLSTLPLIFVEIGSSETQWPEKSFAEAIAKSILEPDTRDLPVAIGFGGGHYAPRFSDLCAHGGADFGHIAPNYHLARLDGKMVAQMRDRTPGCGFYSLHLKEAGEISRIARFCEDAGLKPLD